LNPVLCEASYCTLFFTVGRIALFSCRNKVLGDTKVVNIIEDWDVLEEYAGEKLGFYQLLSNDGIIEIRIQTGRLGFKKEFTAGNDPLLTKILDFCKKRRFIQISENMRDDQFFK
jgi:hypothetical protein